MIYVYLVYYKIYYNGNSGLLTVDYLVPGHYNIFFRDET